MIKKREKPKTYYLAAPGYGVLSFSALDRLLLHFSIGIFIIFMRAHLSISLHRSLFFLCLGLGVLVSLTLGLQLEGADLHGKVLVCTIGLAPELILL
jgi:hypothetical protein